MNTDGYSKFICDLTIAKDAIVELQNLPEAGTTRVLVLNEYINKLNELRDILKNYQELLARDISDMQKIYDDFLKADTIK